MRSALRVSLIYLLISSGWIVFSDSILSFFVPNIENFVGLSIVKGFFFVLTTATLLYFLVHHEIKIKNRYIQELNQSVSLKDDLINELHHRVRNNLQLLSGTIELETSKNGYTQETFKIVRNKIHAINSIQNLVYNLKDMTRISFAETLKTYVKNVMASNPSIEVNVSDQIVYNIETMVTLMLTINDILENCGIHRNNMIEKLMILSNQKNRVEIEIQYLSKDRCIISDLQKMDFSMFHYSLDGQVSMTDHENGIRILMLLPAHSSAQ